MAGAGFKFRNGNDDMHPITRFFGLLAAILASASFKAYATEAADIIYLGGPILTTNDPNQVKRQEPKDRRFLTVSTQQDERQPG